MAIDTANLEKMLSELRNAAALAQGGAAGKAQGTGGVDFAQVLNNTIEQVNQAQQQAQQLTEEFATGKADVNLQDVMINLQKASLSFQAMTEVRNRLVEAYQQIMNMPI